jgi:hypothetical protein
MIRLRTGFYFLYVALGTIILVRVLSFGVRFETITGIVLGILLIALGIYRLFQVTRVRTSKR